jgi:outer membrane protein assembly factor BamE (lipoprotein component of BamABCDE complex)
MKRILTLTFLMLAVALSMACASGGGGGGGDQTKAAAAVEVPASSPLAKVKVGMTDSEVRGILGEPSDTNAYMSGKAFIPMYYGSDTHRSDWMYKGVGRVVFSRNRYSGALKVIKLIHNPDEP